MNVKITVTGHHRGEQTLLFDELGTALRDAGFSCREQMSDTEVGEKGDVPIAILLTGLAAQSIGALVAVLAFWRNGRPTHTITVKRGRVTYTLGNLSEKKAEERLNELRAEFTNEVEVEIS